MGVVEWRCEATGETRATGIGGAGGGDGEYLVCAV